MLPNRQQLINEQVCFFYVKEKRTAFEFPLFEWIRLQRLRRLNWTGQTANFSYLILEKNQSDLYRFINFSSKSNIIGLIGLIKPQ